MLADQPHPPFLSPAVGGHPPHSPAPESPEDLLASAATAAVQQTPPTRSAAVTCTGCAFSEKGKEATRRFALGRSAENPVLVYVRAEDNEVDDALGF